MAGGQGHDALRVFVTGRLLWRAGDGSSRGEAPSIKARGASACGVGGVTSKRGSVVAGDVRECSTRERKPGSRGLRGDGGRHVVLVVLSEPKRRGAVRRVLKKGRRVLQAEKRAEGRGKESREGRKRARQPRVRGSSLVTREHGLDEQKPNTEKGLSDRRTYPSLPAGLIPEVILPQWG